jgi:hypothetical protein
VVIGENVQNALFVTESGQAVLGAGEQSACDAMALSSRRDREQADHRRIGRIRRHSAACYRRQHESDKLAVGILSDDPALGSPELGSGTRGHAIMCSTIPSSARVNPQAQATLEISRSARAECGNLLGLRSVHRPPW